MNAIDTNILIYSIDAGEPRKRLRAIELMSSLSVTDTVIPWQVACELTAVLGSMARTGRFRGDHSKTVASLRACFPIVIPNLTTLDRALRIQNDAQMSAWDSILIAACADAGVSRLYTEDMQSRPVIEGIELVNPFL